MSSLKDPVSRLDLSPDISRPIAMGGFAQYFYPLFWAFYSPDALIRYVNTISAVNDMTDDGAVENGENSGKGTPSVNNDVGIQSVNKITWRLFIIIIVLSAILLTLYGMVDAAIARIVGSTSFTLLDLAAGWIGVFFGGSVAIFCFWFIQDLPLRIAAQSVFGLTASLMTGLYFMDARLQLPGPTIVVASIGVGILWGVYLNTLDWYEKSSIMLDVGLPLFSSIIGLLIFLAYWLIVDILIIELALLAGIFFFFITFFRFDDWLLYFNRRLDLAQEPIYKILPCVTLLPVRKLSPVLEDELEQDWKIALQNCVEVWQYTNQHDEVLKAIHTLLDDKSKEESADKRKSLVGEVEQLWQTFYRKSVPLKMADGTITALRLSRAVRPDFWAKDLRIFLPRKQFKIGRPFTNAYSWIKKAMQVKPKDNRSGFEKRYAKRQKKSGRAIQRKALEQKLALNTPVENAVAGLWYLEKQYPKEAEEAFSGVNFSPLGSEMASIAKMLETLWTSEKLSDLGLLTLPKPPENPAHKDTWESFTSFRNIVRYVWLLKRCDDAGNYFQVALMLMVAVQKLLQSSNELVEKQVIHSIATDWDREIRELINTINYIPKLKPVTIPFVFTEPLTLADKSLMVDRRTEQTCLNDAWKVGNFQPVLINGQHQSGKTSLLQIAAGSKISLVLIRLRQLGIRSNTVHILQAICDEIQRQNIYPISISDQINEDPYRVFSHYIKDVCLQLGKRGLVVGLDEFEFIEQNSNRHELRALMSFLWSLSQSESNLGVAFITASTLPELNRAFDTPFTRYMQPITLGFLTEKGVAQLLRHPTTDFLPYCNDLAVRRIMELTAGQPYLVQLCATFLFEWYNSEIRAERKPSQDPLLTYLDVDQAVESESFHLQCERYYRGICDEAMRIDSDYAMQILRKIKHAQYAPNNDEILAQNPDRQRINSTLSLLEAHLIIEKDSADPLLPARWRIKVPLFHDWL